MNGCFFCPMKLQRRMTGASKEIQEQHESSPYNVYINYIFPLKPYISLVWWTDVFFAFMVLLLEP